MTNDFHPPTNSQPRGIVAHGPAPHSRSSAAGVRNDGVDRTTPMGATLVQGGVTFRTWAPNARDVFVVTDATSTGDFAHFVEDPAARLLPLGDGTWAGFVADLKDGDPYLFWIVGPEGGTLGYKRDPYAREMAPKPDYPACPCLVRHKHGYPWRSTGFRSRPYHELVIYQLHIGVYWAVDGEGRDRRREYGRFLDVIERLPYLKDLGVTAIQLLPIQEFDQAIGLGYAGLDYFSPETAYQLEDEADLARRLTLLNRLFATFDQPPLALDDIRSGPNQLKALIDLCHLHGLSVIFDLVYNHAGGGFDDRSLFYFDRQAPGDDNRSLYFTDKGWAGGKVFAYWQAPVRQFLIDNARFFLDEYAIDGIRYDEVTVMHHHGGDDFCRDLTGTLRFDRPALIQIAEYWDHDRSYPITATPAGLGFDAVISDRLRNAVRSAVRQAAAGRSARVELDQVAAALRAPPGVPGWSQVNAVEDHDIVRWDYGANAPRAPRIPRLADSSDARSWYARSRSRVATGLLLTAPGIPMLFMGQEFLEDKPWHDDVKNWGQFLIWWDGLDGRDRAMSDHHRFTRELIALRRSQPALQGDRVNPYHVHNENRVLVFHRWLEGSGRDVVVAATLSEATWWGYSIGMPKSGPWREVFNSDVYDHWVNPAVAGNGGGIDASGPPMHGLPASASIVIPANGFVVLAT